MKLEVGMYVRTNDGYINKIKKVNQYNVLVDARDLFGEELNIPNNEIIKASHNIIDLIEEGDYVNGKEVICNEKYELKLVDIKGNWGIRFVEEAEIETIVTKEQFESMAYKVVEE